MEGREEIPSSVLLLDGDLMIHCGYSAGGALELQEGVSGSSMDSQKSPSSHSFEV